MQYSVWIEVILCLRTHATLAINAILHGIQLIDKRKQHSTKTPIVEHNHSTPRTLKKETKMRNVRPQIRAKTRKLGLAQLESNLYM